MNAYGTVLKQLIQLTGSKLSTISDVIGYDVSYISKWCNKSMLPAANGPGDKQKHGFTFCSGDFEPGNSGRF